MPAKKIDPALWIFILYFAILIVFYRLSPTIIGAVVLGLYLSMIIMVPARLLMKIKFINQKAAIVISALLVFSLLSVTVIMIFPIIIDEAANLFKTLTESNLSIDALLDGLPNFLKDLQTNSQFIELLQQLGTKIVTTFSSFGMGIVNTLISQIPNALTAVVIFVLASAYLTAQIPVFRKNLWRFFPASSFKKSSKFVSDYYHSIRSFIGGQLIIAAVVGLIIGVGFTIAGIPYALFLGFLSFVTNFIPFLGVILTAVPAIFLGLSHFGLMGLLRVGIVLILANQIEAWVLSPKIQGDRMELNWFVILVGILLFGSLFGIVGVLFAVPILVFIKEFWMSYIQVAFKKV